MKCRAAPILLFTTLLWDYEKETGATLMDLHFRPMWKQCPDFAATVCRSR